mmetsp:Transcript_28596/g.87551  ORF Transcript_28596/g.87551 Transcript_28596/m.87551 type:complete len:90 (-) Transcript_28596:162-431(-)
MSTPPPPQPPAEVEVEPPVELYAEEKNEMCSAACVTCGDSEASQWTITQSIACLVASGCVVLPPEDFEEAVAAETPAPSPAAPPTVNAQ